MPQFMPSISAMTTQDHLTYHNCRNNRWTTLHVHGKPWSQVIPNPKKHSETLPRMKCTTWKSFWNSQEIKIVWKQDWIHKLKRAEKRRKPEWWFRSDRNTCCCCCSSSSSAFKLPTQLQTGEICRSTLKDRLASPLDRVRAVCLFCGILVCSQSGNHP